MTIRIPSTVPLPLDLVDILETKFTSGGALPPACLHKWLDIQSSLRTTIDSLQRYASHPELEARATRSADSLQSLNSALIQGSFDDATAEAFKLYYAIASYGAAREELRVTSLEQNDKLIHACKACEEGRLPLPELVHLVAPATDEIDVMVSYFRRAADSLPEPIQQAFLKGIQSSQAGLSSLGSLAQHATLDPEQVGSLKTATANLRNGALILQELQSWGLELAKEERSGVPAVGDFVKKLRGVLREQGRIPDDLLAEWVDQAFWVLQDRWTEDRHDFFMPRFKKDRLVASIDGLMLRLRDLHEYKPQEQDEMLYLLEIKFEEVEGSAFNIETLAKHPLAWLADYLVAALSKGVPRAHIKSQISTFLDTEYDQYGRLLQSFLNEDDRDYLLDALALMQSEVETAETEL